MDYCNMDLGASSDPLNCPRGRLSPAKSTGSIDQYPYYHRKGDSAYSSFSGGSSAPEYFPDDLCPQNLLYAGLKGMQGPDSPDVLSSSCRSVQGSQEDDEDQYHKSFFLQQEFPPPPPPLHMESFTVKSNLENYRTNDSPNSHQGSNLYQRCWTSSVDVRNAKHEPVQGHWVSYSNLMDLMNSETFREESRCQSSVINGNIQCKGPYYFVTGVVRPNEFSHSVSLDGGGFVSSPESSNSHMVLNKEKASMQWCSHQDNNSLKKNVCTDSSNGLRAKYCPSYSSNQGSLPHSQLPNIQSNERGNRLLKHHNSCQHIFDCGPENGACPPKLINNERRSSLQGLYQLSSNCGSEGTDGVRRQPLLDSSRDVINKKSTPLLYHLTSNGKVTLNRTHNEDMVNRKEIKQNRGIDTLLGLEASGPTTYYGSTNASSPYQEEFPSNSAEDLNNAHILPSLIFRNSNRSQNKNNVNGTQHKCQREPNVSVSLKITQMPEEIPQQIPSPASGILSKPDSLVTMENAAIQGKGEQSGEENLVQTRGGGGLMQEPGKLCYSDPEKLNQIDDIPPYSVFSNRDNQEESLLGGVDLSCTGLVANRRKLFETKGRALSASCLTKASLKQIQQKALLAYMERKTSCLITEPNQFACTPTKKQSLHGRMSEGTFNSLGINMYHRKKLTRTLHENHLLDYSTQCYERRTPIPLPSEQGKEENTPTSGKFTSVDRLKQPYFHRERSTSTPHLFQIMNESLTGSNQISSLQKNAESETSLNKSHLTTLPEKRSAWRKISRGMSLEERLGKPKGIVSSLEPVEILRNRLARQAWEKRSVSEGEGERKQCTYRKPFFKQESAPQLHIDKDPMEDSGLCDGTSHVKAQELTRRCDRSLSASGSPLSASVHSQGSPERDDNTTSLTASKDPRMKTSSSVHLSLLELSDDDPEEITTLYPFWEAAQNQEESTKSWLITLEAGKSEDQEELGSRRVMTINGSQDKTQTIISLPKQDGTSKEHSPPGREEVDEEKGVSVDEPEDLNSTAPKIKVTLKWQQLAEEVVAGDQSLARILFSTNNGDTVVTLMEQLLSEDASLMEEHFKRKQSQNKCESKKVVDRFLVSNEKISPSDDGQPIDEGQIQDTGQPEPTTERGVTEKKKQLMVCIQQHLRELEQNRVTLQQEIRDHEKRADAVAALVQDKCSPGEYERYTQFICDMERVISLLLCLSARLARVQNAMSSVDQHTDAEEKESLTNRHRLLCKQRDDAKELRSNLDRREQVVASILAKSLTQEQLQDFRRLVQTKASLLIMQKDVEERLRLGEEQLQCLLHSLPP